MTKFIVYTLNLYVKFLQHISNCSVTCNKITGWCTCGLGSWTVSVQSVALKISIYEAHNQNQLSLSYMQTKVCLEILSILSLILAWNGQLRCLAVWPNFTAIACLLSLRLQHLYWMYWQWNCLLALECNETFANFTSSCNYF